MTRMGLGRVVGAAVVTALVAAGCGKKPTPVARPMPPPPPSGRHRACRPPPPPPPPIDEPPVLPARGAGRRHRQQGSSMPSTASCRWQPVFFALDSFEIDRRRPRHPAGHSAEVLRQQPTWQITVEGHCDERGTAEYNLSLGERRAVAAKTYLVIARHRRRAAAHRELRQGVPVRSRPRRGGVGEEPPRAFRDHGKVAPTPRGRSCMLTMRVMMTSRASGARGAGGRAAGGRAGSGPAAGTAADWQRICASCRSRPSCCRTPSSR